MVKLLFCIGVVSDINYLMKIGDYEFNFRELSGSLGDFGTLLSFVIGYITVCGMNPTGILITVGLANILTGLYYKLPMPIEPMKVIAAVAIAGAWSPEKIYTVAFAMGIVWLLLGALNVMGHVARMTPRPVVWGVQFSLGALLAIEGWNMMSTGWLIGILALLVVLLFRKSRYVPATILLVFMGIGIMLARGEIVLSRVWSLSLPPLTMFDLDYLIPSFTEAGFAQIPLTATNAVIATAILIAAYFPDRKATERKLSLSMGAINAVLPFFGGIPLCHGAGGLAGQYYFGARTGGANLIEGVIEISLGLFLGASIAAIFSGFPMAIVGAMMLLVGIELVKFARSVRFDWEIIPLGTTVLFALIANMAVGFVTGFFVYYIFYFVRGKKKGGDIGKDARPRKKPLIYNEIKKRLKNATIKSDE